MRCCISQFDGESLICGLALSTLKGRGERGREIERGRGREKEGEREGEKDHNINR